MRFDVLCTTDLFFFENATFFPFYTLHKCDIATSLRFRLTYGGPYIERGSGYVDAAFPSSPNCTITQSGSQSSCTTAIHALDTTLTTRFRDWALHQEKFGVLPRPLPVAHLRPRVSLHIRDTEL